MHYASSSISGEKGPTKQNCFENKCTHNLLFPYPSSPVAPIDTPTMTRGRPVNTKITKSLTE